MVLFYTSNALGDAEPVMIYAGKDKVRTTHPRAAFEQRIEDSLSLTLTAPLWQFESTPFEAAPQSLRPLRPS